VKHFILLNCYPIIKRALVTVILFLTANAWATSHEEKSHYTSINYADCKKLSDKRAEFYAKRDLGALECPGFKNWRVFSVSADRNSWLELVSDKQTWSTEEQVVYKNDFGHFPNLGSKKIEWRVDHNGDPFALIFRVSVQNPKNIHKDISRLFVLRLKDNTAAFCGVAKTNQQARKLAGPTRPCKKTLPIL